MGTDLTSKIPIKQHIKNMRRILALISTLDKTYFSTACIVHIINASIPYIELILSAYVLDALVEGKEFATIFMAAAITTVCIFILHCIACTIWNQLEVRCRSICKTYECITEHKMLHMDYAKIDSPQIKDLKDRIRNDNNWGAGLLGVFWQVNGILHGSVSLLLALIVGAPVIYYIIVSGRLLIYGILLFIVIAIVASQKGFSYYQKKVNQFMFRTFETDEERKERTCVTWNYVYGDGFRYGDGKDIRIYKAYDVQKHWTIEKNESELVKKDIKLVTKDCFSAEAIKSMGLGVLEAGAYILVGMLAIGGTLSVGAVVKLAGCLKGIFSEGQTIAGNVISFALTARKQVSTLDLLEISDDMYKGKLPVEKRSDNQYQIEFKNVSFRYPGADNYALKNFSLTLKIGEKLAIVGMNGSGKTTMVKLLCRLYDPDGGEILLNGVDIKKFKQEEYSRLLSVVFQDYQLFSFMLAENVAVSGKYDSSKVKKCLEDAGLADRVKTLEKGIESYLYKDFEDDGIEISGGEAQKIAIARAIYKDAPFILLDEPTAALDPISEHEIYASFDKIVGNKTAIYISHRLSSCRFCEKIAVFHEGQLIQLGSHEELVSDTKGKYYELWNAQAKYYVTA